MIRPWVTVTEIPESGRADRLPSAGVMWTRAALATGVGLGEGAGTVAPGLPPPGAVLGSRDAAPPLAGGFAAPDVWQAVPRRQSIATIEPMTIGERVHRAATVTARRSG
ncbi:MAG TPA: hypothetical protein VGB19_04840 [Actinomycetota bacterium]